MFFFLFDPLYLVVTLVGVALTAVAQWRVKSAFRKYSKVPVRSGMTGAQAAAAVCSAGNTGPVTIERHEGFMSDHYDPRSKTLRLSPEVYEGRSISSIAVAAHEAGHSIQDATAYPLLGFRSKMVSLTNLGSRMWAMPFMIGMFLAAGQERATEAGAAGWNTGQYLMAFGILCFGAVVLFQLVTLPVEIDASRRAKAVLAQTGIVQTQEEAVGVSRVLDAAAWTYVAAAAAGILQLIYLIMRFNRR
jgi:Zn-dependent membrane protease YugP